MIVDLLTPAGITVSDFVSCAMLTEIVRNMPMREGDVLVAFSGAAYMHAKWVGPSLMSVFNYTYITLDAVLQAQSGDGMTHVLHLAPFKVKRCVVDLHRYMKDPSLTMSDASGYLSDKPFCVDCLEAVSQLLRKYTTAEVHSGATAALAMYRCMIAGNLPIIQERVVVKEKERIVVKHKQVDRIIFQPQYVDRVVEKIVPKIVYVDKPVDRIVYRDVERVVYVDKIVEREVIREVQPAPQTVPAASVDYRYIPKPVRRLGSDQRVRQEEAFIDRVVLAGLRLISHFEAGTIKVTKRLTRRDGSVVSFADEFGILAIWRSGTSIDVIGSEFDISADRVYDLINRRSAMYRRSLAIIEAIIAGGE